MIYLVTSSRTRESSNGSTRAIFAVHADFERQATSTIERFTAMDNSMPLKPLGSSDIFPRNTQRSNG